MAGALASLRGSKLRSFLTLLGIILATTTLIAVMSVIEGMDRYIAQNVSDMGADGFKVRRIVMMQWDPKKFMEMQRRNPQLTRDEFEFLKSRATLVREIGMHGLPRRGGALRAAARRERGPAGRHPEHRGDRATIRPRRAASSPISEDQRRLAVCFIGKDLKDRFFPNSNPIGKTLTVQGRPFEVVGVAKAKGSRVRQIARTIS